MKSSSFRQNFSLEWGPRGHQLIAQAAEQLLTEKASNAVKNILSTLENANLKSIAIWADLIKSNPPNDDDTTQFLKDYPKKVSEKWHFVDLPLEAAAYDRTLYSTFTRDDDIVQILNRSINVLFDKDSMMSKLNGLRWITHLVGDIHQPLHVGCGYIDESGAKPILNFNPEYIQSHNLSSDQGGNFIILSKDSEKELNLHSYWDGMLGFKEPTNIGLADTTWTENEEALVNQIINTIKSSEKKWFIDEVYESATIDQWAAGWATESLAKAREAYKTIVIESKISDRKFRVAWEGKEKYETRCTPIVKEQLQKAIQRLAKLLNTIFQQIF
jgi:hypothetical protein